MTAERTGAWSHVEMLQQGDVILTTDGDKCVFQYATKEHDGRFRINATRWNSSLRCWFTVSRTTRVQFA